ncbi:ABC transporter family protein [Giardia muris]|uniref:ABC transporter family protein n=1 Tax=Giardia muris TaxID=5742 RepID=A0A4Z1SUE3_GIAMU|nr:ABC transporter family protein [Giardia muris]|eukprot:TNJ29464.1 ABC transporter family protein [Giardia muris]
MRVRLHRFYTSQFRALLFKHYTDMVQGNWIVMFLRLAVPLVLILILYFPPLIAGLKDSSADIMPLWDEGGMGLPHCLVLDSSDGPYGYGSIIPQSTARCKMLGVYPNNSFVNKIVERMAKNDKVSLDQFVMFDDATEADAYVSKNPGMLAALVGFEADFTNTTSIIKNLAIHIGYNFTLVKFPNFYAFYQEDTISLYSLKSQHTTIPLRIQHAVGRALLQELDGVNVDYNPRYGRVPAGNKDPPTMPDRFASLILPVVVLMVHFLLTLNSVVAEKDSGRFESLRLMGVNDCIYWCSQLAFHLLIYGLGLIPYLFGAYILPGGTSYYQWIDPVTVLLFFIIGGVLFTILGLFVGSLTTTVRTGMIFGFLILAFIFVSFQVILIFGAKRFFDPTFINQFGTAVLFTLVPFFPIIVFWLIVIDSISIDTVIDPHTQWLHLDASETKWSFGSLFTRKKITCFRGDSNCTVKIAPPILLFVSLSINAIIFFLLTWFASEGLPTCGSLRRKPWELFTREYWKTTGGSYLASDMLTDAVEAAEDGNDDEDTPLVDEAPRRSSSGCLRSRGECKHGRRSVTANIAQRVLLSLGVIDSDVETAVMDILTAPKLSNTALVANHIQKTFPQGKLCSRTHTRVVRGITLQIRTGQILGLLGHNGAGKSTFMGCLIGATRPDPPSDSLLGTAATLRNPPLGNAWIDGLSIRYQMNHIRRRIGVCPQFNTTLWPGLTPEQHLRFVCLLHNVPEFDIPTLTEKSLRRVALHEYRDKACKKFSGGMQRRLCIAVAMCGYPRLLLFDEATTGTDPETKRIVWSAIRDVSRTPQKVPLVEKYGRSLYVRRIERPAPGILLTSHDMAEVEYLADEVAIIASGSVIASGTTLRLKRRFGKGLQLTIVCTSTRAANIFAAMLPRWLRETFPSVTYTRSADKDAHQLGTAAISLLDQTGQTLVLAISQDAEQVISGLLAFAEQNKRIPGPDGILVEDILLDETSLEDVFLRLGRIYQAGVYSQLQRFTSQDNDQDDTSTSTLHGSEGSMFVEPEPQDQYVNQGYTEIKHFTPEMITEILHPKRVQPRVFVALFLKMIKQDMTAKVGLFSALLLPIILITVGWLLGNYLIPWIISIVNDITDTKRENMHILCGLCHLLSTIPGIGYIPQCTGFDSFGRGLPCEKASMYAGEPINQSIIWVGGGLYSNPDQSPLQTSDPLNLQLTTFSQGVQLPSQVIVFDTEKLFSTDDLSTPGLEFTNSMAGNNISTTVNVTIPTTNISINVTYEKNWLMDITGRPITVDLQEQVSTHMKTYYTSGKGAKALKSTPERPNFLDFMTLKPIAVPIYLDNNQTTEQYSLRPDFFYNDGLTSYGTLDYLAESFLKFQYTDGTNYPETLRSMQLSPTCQKQAFCWAVLNPSDQATVQIFLNYSLMAIPAVVLDLDRSLQLRSDNSLIFAPKIYSYAKPIPGRSPYDNMQAGVRWRKKEIYNRIQKLGVPKSVLDIIWEGEPVFGPPGAMHPTIFRNMDINDVTAISLHNEFHARLLEAVVRARLGIVPGASYTDYKNSVNIRFGIKPWDWTWDLAFDTGSDKIKEMVTILLVALACLSMFPIHIYPVVLDRQQGIRQMFTLNGVPGWLYWLTNFVYQLILALIAHYAVIFFGYFIFQITLFNKMDIWLLLLIFTTGAIGQLATAFLFSLCFPTTQLATLFGYVFIIIITVVLLLNGDFQTGVLHWWYFFTPVMSMAAIFGFMSWSTQTISTFFKSSFGWLIPGIWIESIIFLVLTIYLDYVIPRPSVGVPKPWYFPFICTCRKMRKPAFNHDNPDLIPLTGSAIHPASAYSSIDPDRIEDCDTMPLSGGHIQPPMNLELNDLPTYRGKPLPPPTTARDRAVRSNEIDPDVWAERRRMVAGLSNTTPLIVCNLEKFYRPSFIAVRDISFHIPPSTCFALLGSNGAGKSTSISIMTGLVRATRGTAIINGWDVRRDAQEVHRHIGLCPQHDAYVPTLTVRDHLLLFARLHGVSRADEAIVVSHIAAFVHLRDVLDRQARHLSGGMRRRLSLIIALIG